MFLKPFLEVPLVPLKPLFQIVWMCISPVIHLCCVLLVIFSITLLAFIARHGRTISILLFNVNMCIALFSQGYTVASLRAIQLGRARWVFDQIYAAKCRANDTRSHLLFALSATEDIVQRGTPVQCFHLHHLLSLGIKRIVYRSYPRSF